MQKPILLSIDGRQRLQYTGMIDESTKCKNKGGGV
jgi:hypothetical protein